MQVYGYNTKSMLGSAYMQDMVQQPTAQINSPQLAPDFGLMSGLQCIVEKVRFFFGFRDVNLNTPIASTIAENAMFFSGYRTIQRLWLCTTATVENGIANAKPTTQGGIPKVRFRRGLTHFEVGQWTCTHLYCGGGEQCRPRCDYVRFQ